MKNLHTILLVQETNEKYEVIREWRGSFHTLFDPIYQKNGPCPLPKETVAMLAFGSGFEKNFRAGIIEAGYTDMSNSYGDNVITMTQTKPQDTGRCTDARIVGTSFGFYFTEQYISRGD